MIVDGAICAHGKFRLWQDEVHLAVCDMEGSRELMFDCSSWVDEGCLPRVVVVEVMIPRGGRAIYGLLGGIYSPHTNAHQLRVRIPRNQSFGGVYADSMVAAFDTARVGLPNEYAEAAIAGIKQAISGGVSPFPGVLSMCFAACGDVSSNAPIFTQLGSVLMGLFCGGKRAISSEVAQAFFEQRVR